MTSQQYGRLTAKVSTNIMEHIFLVLSTTDNFLNTENCVLYFRNHVHHFFGCAGKLVTADCFKLSFRAHYEDDRDLR